MKKIDEFISSDQAGHLTGMGLLLPTFYDKTRNKTRAEKKEFVKGLFTGYPYMLISNYHKWLFEGDKNVKNYDEFMKSRQPDTIAKVIPLLDMYFDETNKYPYQQKVDAMTGLFTELPYTILGNYHKWLYTGTKDAKDFQGFIDATKTTAVSILGGVILKAYYNQEKPLAPVEKAEIMIFFAAMFPYIFLRKYFVWLFGVDKDTLPPGATL